MNCVKGSIHKSWDNFSASSVSDPVSQPLSLHSVHPLLLKDKGGCWVHLVGCSVGKELHFSSQWYDGKQLQQRVSCRWVSSISGLSRSQAWDQVWEYNAQNCLCTEIRAEEVRALRASAGAVLSRRASCTSLEGLVSLFFLWIFLFGTRGVAQYFKQQRLMEQIDCPDSLWGKISP